MFINIVLFNIHCFISQKKYEKSGATYIFIAERHFFNTARNIKEIIYHTHCQNKKINYKVKLTNKKLLTA